MYQLAKFIKDVCEDHSDKVAVRFYSDGCVKWIFYHEFDRAADLMAAILNQVMSNFEIVTHNYIAVLVDVSDIYPVIIQGILLFGRPFVCLDVDGSKSDLINLIEKLKIEILLTNEKHADNIRTNFDKSEKLKEFKLFEHACVIWKTGISHDECNNDENLDKRLLYAIQTSGSTGEKKIVQVTENCILPNILELREIFRLSCADVIYYGSPITFDPNIVELFLALTSGASLFIVSSKARAASIPVLVDVLFPPQQSSESDSSSSCVTFIQTTPSILLAWLKLLTRHRIMNRLKILALGGEECPSCDKLSDYCSPTDFSKIFNLYGITEVSCWASWSNLSARSDCHTLGVPMRETLLQVRDAAGNVVNDGIGEMFIGSNSRLCIVGYDSISKVLADSEKEPLFRATGDLVQVENDGKVFRFLGRKDRVVKRWGQKVNLGLIEEAARKNAYVSNCCCINDDRQGLVLLYQTDNVKIGADNELRCWLKTDGLLPNNASIPDTIVQVHELPLNSNGKIDRSHLKKLLNEPDPAVGNEIPGLHRIPFRQHLRSLWTCCTSGSSLNFETQNVISNESSSCAGFVSSGGTSISALQFISELLSKFHQKVPSELLANLLADCTFDECYNLFDGTKCAESSELTFNPKQKTFLDVSEPKMKRQKVDHSIFQNNAESAVISVKCRGQLVMYSQIYNENNELNLSEKISLNVKWKYFLKKCVDASPTVIAFKNGTTTVTVGSHSGDLVNLDFESGLLKSACHLPDRIESSLAVSSCGKYGYIGCYDGYLRCIEMETGEAVLSFATTGMIKSSPVQHNQGPIIFGSYDQHLYCITDKFQVVWKWKGAGSFYATPCIDHNKNLVFSGLLDGSCVCLQIDSGVPVWKTKLSSPIFSSPILLHSDTILFVEVSGSVNCLNTVCGSLLWSYKADGNIFSSLTSASLNNHTLFLFGCHDNNVYCLSAARDVRNAPYLIWKTCLSAPVFATPFVHLKSDLAVVANTSGTIFILKLIDGVLLISLKLPGEIFSSPVVHDNRIVVGCRDNYLYCICMDNVNKL